MAETKKKKTEANEKTDLESSKKKTVKKTTKKTVKKTSEKDPSTEKEDKLAKLREKAKKLEASVDEAKDIDLKKEFSSEEEQKDGLVSIEDYLKSSIHLGTRVMTPDMKSYVYKRRADGLAVFNTAMLDEMIKAGAEYLSKFAPEDVILVCKREAGWNAAKLFSKVTGVKTFTKKYPAGILTNPQLEDFIETELVVICDPWLDKNALADANNVGLKVLAICDTNNYTKGIDRFIPGNNKSAKSIGMILFLLAKLYTEMRGIKTEVPPISEWIENWDSLVPPK